MDTLCENLAASQLADCESGAHTKQHRFIDSTVVWQPLASFEEHSDFVSQIVCTPKPLGRVFSCGYDGFICAFELNVEDRCVSWPL